MSEKKHYKCDVCGHDISIGHQEYYMVTLSADHLIKVDDGSAAGAERKVERYHVHNDFSHHCMSKVWDLLVKDRK